MYGKIFDSIYDGTLVEDWRALITFQQLIILCDSDGIVDMTHHALARRTGIPIEHIESGIKILESKDPYSRSNNEDGRRITRLDDHRDWGWQIVNHKHYRNMKNHEDRREYKRKKQQEYREKDSKNSNKINDRVDTKCPQKSTKSTSVYVYVCSLYKDIDEKAWLDFEDHRKEIKKPLTEKAASLAAKKMSGYSKETQQQMVDDAIEKRWTTVFLPKEEKQSTEVIYQ